MKKQRQWESLKKTELLKLLHAQELEIIELTGRLNTLASKNYNLEQRVKQQDILAAWIGSLAETSARLNEALTAAEKQSAAPAAAMPTFADSEPLPQGNYINNQQPQDASLNTAEAILPEPEGGQI